MKEIFSSLAVIPDPPETTTTGESSSLFDHVGDHYGDRDNQISYHISKADLLSFQSLCSHRSNWYRINLHPPLYNKANSSASYLI